MKKQSSLSPISRRPILNLIFSSFFLLLNLLFLTSVSAFPQEVTLAHEVTSTLTRQELSEAILNRLERVEEFREIKKISEEMKVPVYLFGGTAAAYAHYVKWDLLRERGDKRFQPDRFDYDYTNIFRSNQDMDIVIDGTPEQAEKLESYLAAKFPFFQGNKTVWEVRLLREARGEKDALLKNPDFLNQHTDSNSTGMIGISHQGGIRDLRDWENAEYPQFFEDVYQGKLHYFFNEKHKTTKRYRQGLNPPIISVIRYLTKAFQYELEIHPSSMEIIGKIIKEWDVKKFKKENSYVQHWMEKNAKKLIQNAVNIEYAWNILNELKLREKLAAIGDQSIGGLGWWMNKEPLFAKEVGKGFGKTAQKLGIDIVAHETNSFDAYESITRAHTGEPNVLISRPHFPGEAAVHGEGFYTARGKKGMKGTGITIRFRVDPQAKNGTDFVDVGNGMVIFRNKKALTVIPETLNLSMLEFFEKLSKKEILFDYDDRAVQEKVKRKLRNQSTRISREEAQKMAEIVQNSDWTTHDNPLVEEWLKLPISCHFPQLLWEKATNPKNHMNHLRVLLRETDNRSSCWGQDLSLFKKLMENEVAAEEYMKNILNQHNILNELPQKVQRDLVNKEDLIEWGEDLIKNQLLMDSPSRRKFWEEHPKILESLVQKGNSLIQGELLNIRLLSKDFLARNPVILEKVIKKGGLDKYIARAILTDERWKDRSEWVEELLRRGNCDSELAEYVLSQEQWQGRKDWVETLLVRGKSDKEIVQYILSQPLWKDYPELVEKLLKKGTVDFYIVIYILQSEHWKGHPEWVEKLLAKKNVDSWIASALGRKHWKDHPEWVEKLLDRNSADSDIAQSILSKEQWKGYPEWIDKLLERKSLSTESYLAHYALTQDHWKDHPKWVDWVEELLKRGRHQVTFIQQILSRPHEKLRPEWVEKMINEGRWDKEIVEHVLSQEHWKDHPEWVEIMLNRKNEDLEKLLIQHVLSKAHWKNHPEWVEKLFARGKKHKYSQYRSLEWEIVTHILSKDHWKDHPEWLNKAMTRGKLEWAISKYAFSQNHWKDHSGILKKLIKKKVPKLSYYHEMLVRDVLSQEHWEDHPELVVQMIEEWFKSRRKGEKLEELLQNSPWKDNKNLKRLLSEKYLPEKRPGWEQCWPHYFPKKNILSADFQKFLQDFVNN